ncbi:diacylglycerol kinase epsilon [Lingula anatina]|uniref:Diacylglycerol kinase n=1 Tax=Lingula anatina TaxID=7574 RepID=A0A1S3HQV9_LINAN|nr:diacylglycerol kinase epsilon [Lingula anatina]|eukprot:XP_013387424.1 diacylglycerol kinase epsilon [Lingula anatina]
MLPIMPPLIGAVVYVSGAVILTVIICQIYRCRRKRHYEVPARDISKGHRWSMVDAFDKPTYCAVSGENISHGAFCGSCGICVNDHNMKEANGNLPCKALASKSEVTHHWVHGNLPLSSRCCICGELCGIRPELCDFRCCWCQRTIHEECRHENAGYIQICDLGAFKDFIVPPHRVELKLVGFKGRRHWKVGKVLHPSSEDWRPLVVIANRKSGNYDGEHILQVFRGLLNPAQVIDLADMPPGNGLEWAHLVPDVTCRVLVCGGDGTVGWVLSAIDNLKFRKLPEVCILPLGTGNDLSRVLGWGPGYTREVDVTYILNQIKTARVVNLDRWKVEINSQKRFGIPSRSKVLIMNNYASIGVDALVALNFHKHRESRPSLFGSRFINKFWYFTYGTKDVLERECKDLHQKIVLEMDDKLISLPDLEGVVVLNIGSWGGGCQPWGMGKDIPKSRYNDGALEVMGIYSSFHIAQMQVGLAEPLRLGQASKVKIILFGGKAPMQVDGEPWEQRPAEITIVYHNHARMLASLASQQKAL